MMAFLSQPSETTFYISAFLQLVKAFLLQLVKQEFLLNECAYMSGLFSLSVQLTILGLGIVFIVTLNHFIIVTVHLKMI